VQIALFSSYATIRAGAAHSSSTFGHCCIHFEGHIVCGLSDYILKNSMSTQDWAGTMSTYKLLERNSIRK
jgi:hypothetical protein